MHAVKLPDNNPMYFAFFLPPSENIHSTNKQPVQNPTSALTPLSPSPSPSNFPPHLTRLILNLSSKSSPSPPNPIPPPSYPPPLPPGSHNTYPPTRHLTHAPSLTRSRHTPPPSLRGIGICLSRCKLIGSGRDAARCTGGWRRTGTGEFCPTGG